MKRDDVMGALIAVYSKTMDANDDKEKAMRMINAMADRIIALFEAQPRYDNEIISSPSHHYADKS